MKDYQLTEKMSVDELVLQMDAAWGFTAGKLATGVNIMEAMINSQRLRQVPLFPADMSPQAHEA